MAAHWIDEYSAKTKELFGCTIPVSFRGQQLFSVYPSESVWFKRSFDALLAVEFDYVRSLFEELREKGVAGDVVEFGIFRGDCLNRLFEITESIGFQRPVWGFDSFAGLSAPDEKRDSPFWKEGMYAAPRREVEANVKAAQRPRIRLVEGFFADSLQGPEAAKLDKVCFARIDCDIYEPARDCLRYLGPRLVDGSILVFDDWAHHHEVGETLAFFEWLPTVPHLRFKFLAMGPWDHCYFRVHRHR